MAGGPPIPLANVITMRGATWSKDDVIVFGARVSPLSKVSASGGAVSVASKLTDGENSHVMPWFLPDGKHFLFVGANAQNGNRASIRVGSLDSSDSTALLVELAEAPSGIVAIVRRPAFRGKLKHRLARERLAEKACRNRKKQD